MGFRHAMGQRAECRTALVPGLPGGDGYRKGRLLELRGFVPAFRHAVALISADDIEAKKQCPINPEVPRKQVGRTCRVRGTSIAMCQSP